MNSPASTLTSAREQSRTLIAGAELATIANRDGTRRVQDILAHIASWESEVAASLRAALEGGEHTLPLPLDLDMQNERYHEANVHLTAAAALAWWEDARRDLAEAVGRTEGAFSFICPWGKAETVGHVVNDMLEHEATHMEQIRAALGCR